MLGNFVQYPRGPGSQRRSTGRAGELIWGAPVNFTCRNWVTEVSWACTLVRKVPKMPYQASCAGQLFRKSLARSFLELNAPVSIDLENWRM